MSDEYYFSEIQCQKGHIGKRRIPDNACLECLKTPPAVKAKYRNLPGGLKIFKHYCHPDDIAAIEAFIKSLLLKRGIY